MALSGPQMPTTHFDLISSQKVYISTQHKPQSTTPLLHHTTSIYFTHLLQVFSHEDKVYRTESKLCNEQKYINHDTTVNWTVIDKWVDDWCHNIHHYLVYKYYTCSYLPRHSAPVVSVCVLEHSKPSHLSVVKSLNLKSEWMKSFMALAWFPAF